VRPGIQTPVLSKENKESTKPQIERLRFQDSNEGRGNTGVYDGMTHMLS
jgi:hypothetical protein